MSRLAGYIFIDYLANAMVLAQGESTTAPPVFYRHYDLAGMFLIYIFFRDSKGSIDHFQLTDF